MRKALVFGAIVALVLCAIPVCTPGPAVRQVEAPLTPLVSNFAVPVLMYHRIDHLTPKQATSPLMCDLTVSPENFEAEIHYLKENRFTVLTVPQLQDALLGGKPLPERTVAITMDDGYKDNFEMAFPILQHYQANATIFLVTSVIGAANHLDWNDVDAMRVDGVRYGSHTVTHPDLTSLPPPALDYELCESKRVLEQHFNAAITAIAYPSGEFNDRVVKRTRAAGYLSGWKKGGGPVQPGNDPFRLPRVRVRGCTTMQDFKRMVWSGVWTMRMRDSRVALKRPRRQARA